MCYYCRLWRKQMKQRQLPQTHLRRLEMPWTWWMKSCDNWVGLWPVFFCKIDRSLLLADWWVFHLLSYCLAANLDSIDIDKLDELEQNLDDAEQQLLAADIEQRYNDLLASRNQHMTWVVDYSSDLQQLQKDVVNVKDINDTIPRKCYKRITLEPTNPSPSG